MKRKGFFYVLLSGMMLLSCDSWLDHAPYDKVEATKLYTTEAGAQKALNGLYLSLLDRDLYGESLTAVTLDVLAQLYYIPNEHRLVNLREYEFDILNPRLAVVWKKIYLLIAECNIFLEEIEKNQAVYPAENYKLYRGEALALRTFLHFDLFRLFGPLHAGDMDVMGKEYIPYYERYTAIPTPYSTGTEFVSYLFRDINAAIALLKDDPILTDGVGWDREDFWGYRSFRMNLFAAQALKARMYLHAGDKDNAYRVATALLSDRDPDTGEGNRFSSIITRPPAVTNNTWEPMLFTEFLFGMHDLNREEVHRSNFSIDLSAASILLGSTSYLSALFNEPEDARATIWSPVDIGGSISVRGFTKYRVVFVSASNPGDPYRYQVIPLIRAGELFLIAAEAAVTDAERRLWLEALRERRGFQRQNTTRFSDAELVDLLAKEHAREFYGEGQYYYYLKRNNVRSIASNSSTYNVTMQDSYYRFTVPETEENNRK
ncbi:MAG: RagB/SusD family nutrient uptake outer membrane protein [Odoribacteraceae bacterium]|jgi:hypothetical protein|nr:RagB/SusD family nutrient uptake outer membrane protein [Odoribacteraceae bacterium]